MFNRVIFQKLMLWKSSSSRKLLILRGARQVGKTTIVREFGKKFDQYIELNLEIKEDREVFERNLKFEEIVQAIFFKYKMLRNKQKKTLLFIDEIQQSPEAVALLRYFFEKAGDIYVIAAGSLLETLIDVHISFPVGRVQYLFMYPFTFEEYLKAKNEIEAISALNTIPLPKYAHEKLLDLFHEYVLIGGMPEIIQQYLTTKDLVALTPIYRDLLIGYVDDVEKYASNEAARMLIRHVMHSAPYEAGKRITFQNFGQSNYRSQQVKEAILTLQKAMILYLSYPVTTTTLPASPNLKKSPKLYFLDTGLVNYVAGLQANFFGLHDLNNLYHGLITEQIVAQELKVLDLFNNGEINFWTKEKKQSNAEVDFILPHNKYLIPIEVKSGKAGTIRSLHQFMNMVDHQYAVRINSNFISKEKVKTANGKTFNLLSIPYYLIGKITDYFNWFVV